MHDVTTGRCQDLAPILHEHCTCTKSNSQRRKTCLSSVHPYSAYSAYKTPNLKFITFHFNNNSLFYNLDQRMYGAFKRVFTLIIEVLTDAKGTSQYHPYTVTIQLPLRGYMNQRGAL